MLYFDTSYLVRLYTNDLRLLAAAPYFGLVGEDIL